MRKMKNYLPSWRHSADTAANARRSKVIGGRFYGGVLSHMRRSTASFAILQELRAPTEVRKTLASRTYPAVIAVDLGHHERIFE
jgi:hypothetical protein